MKSRKIKTYTYAIYQFLSSFSLALMLSALIMGVYYSIINNTPNMWKEGTIDVLSFGLKGSLGRASSVIFYIGLLITFISWASAIYSIRATKRNMWDSIFILFFFIPFLGNVLCLIAQLVSKEYEFQSGFVDRKKIKEELKKKDISINKDSKIPEKKKLVSKNKKNSNANTDK